MHSSKKQRQEFTKSNLAQNISMKLRWKIAQAAEIRWWKQYLNKKDKDSYLVWKKNYWQDLLTELELQIPDAASCLDAGCGPAGIFTLLEHQKVLALDPLLAAYQQNLAHFDPKDYPYVQFKALPLESFYSDQRFDYIFCLNAINHVSDLDACWDRLFAVAHKDSRLLISIDAHNYSLFKYLFRLLPGDILHPHQYDLKEYQEMIEKRGGHIEFILNKKKEFFFNYYVLSVVLNPKT